MDDNRDIEQVLMNIKNSSGGIIAASLLPVSLSLQLLIFLMRLAKKGLLAAKRVDNFKEFMKQEEGKFTIYNIPLPETKAIYVQMINGFELQMEGEKKKSIRREISKKIEALKKEIPELAQLKMLGIDHCVLPKLNGSDQTIQVAVAQKNDQVFKNWFLNHLTTYMGGGEKGMEELRVFTEGNYTIFNFPFEGEDLKNATKDFDILGINYSVLPDLKVGDNNSQVAVANVDRNKIEVWAKMWRDQQTRKGKEPGEVYVMNQESYMNTGTVEADDYIKKSEPQYQEANQEFEEKSQMVPWKGSSIRKENSEEYMQLANDPEYKKITINGRTLVGNMTPVSGLEKMSENGYFVSRVPFTWGESQELLILPNDHVFRTDEEQTYVAFLPKAGGILTADTNGNVKKNSFDDVYKCYDKVTRNLHSVENLMEGVPLQEAAAPRVEENMNPAAAAPKSAAAKSTTPAMPKKSASTSAPKGAAPVSPKL